jgi:hypothetical protein
MKTKLFIIALVLLALATLNPQLTTARAQGTAFTYQGQLQNNGSPASGTYALTFTLFNTNATGVPVAGPVTNNGVVVSNGLFTVQVDFGSGAFTGQSNWLEIAVATNLTGSFTTLAARQAVTPAPYAIYAETASNVSGTLPASQLAGDANGNLFVGPSGNSITSGSGNSAAGESALKYNTTGNNNTANGNNALVANKTGSDNTASGYDALGVNQFGSYNTAVGYQAGMNITTASSNIDIGNAGTFTDNNVIRIGSGQSQSYIAGNLNGNGGGLTNVTAVALVNGTSIGSGSGNTVSSSGIIYSFIGGGQNNIIQPNSSWSVIGGGQGNTTFYTYNGYATVSGGYSNAALCDYSPIAGGGNNIARGTFPNNVYGYATVGGGGYNSALADYATVSGGVWNIAVFAATVGGGYKNQATNSLATVAGGANNNAGGGNGATVGGGEGNNAIGDHPVVGGGYQNTASGIQATVGGGYQNDATNNFATVPGGNNNIAGGQYSFAAGQQAQALHQGAFVWADSQNAPFSSTANDQFLIRAHGGVGIGTGSPEEALSVVGGMNVDAGNANNGPVGSGGFNQGGPTNGCLSFGTGSSGTGFSGEGIQSKRTSGGTQYDLEFFTGFNKQMVILNNGNVGIGSVNPANLLVVGSASSPAYCNGTTWVNGSDRNSKEHFAAINPGAVLEKVSALPITEWKYKVEANGTEHLGPMAQDFHEAFGLNGADDKHIATVDEEGVALAAIQGLNEKLNEKDTEIQDLKKSVEELKAMVKQLAANK